MSYYYPPVQSSWGTSVPRYSTTYTSGGSGYGTTTGSGYGGSGYGTTMGSGYGSGYGTYPSTTVVRSSSGSVPASPRGSGYGSLATIYSSGQNQYYSLDGQRGYGSSGYGGTDAAAPAGAADPNRPSAAVPASPRRDSTGVAPASPSGSRIRVADTAVSPSSRSSRTSAANDRIGGRPKMTYFKIKRMAARGGVVRFFFLVNDISYDEELISFSEWPERKKRLIETGENPAGLLPIVKLGERTYTDHVSFLRLLSRKLGQYGGNAEEDYYQDMVSNEAQGWRDTWATATFGSEELKETYRGKREGFYRLFEAYYARRPVQRTMYLGGTDRPSFVDLLVFSLIYDDIAAYSTYSLDDFPNLRKLYEATCAIPSMARWIRHAQKE